MEWQNDRMTHLDSLATAITKGIRDASWRCRGSVPRPTLERPGRPRTPPGRGRLQDAPGTRQGRPQDALGTPPGLPRTLLVAALGRRRRRRDASGPSLKKSGHQGCSLDTPKTCRGHTLGENKTNFDSTVQFGFLMVELVYV